MTDRRGPKRRRRERRAAAIGSTIRHDDGTYVPKRIRYQAFDLSAERPTTLKDVKPTTSQ